MLKRTLLTLAQYRPKDVHYFGCLLHQFPSLRFKFGITLRIYQSEPVSAFFGFLATYLYTHYKIFLTQCLIGLNIVR
jgi:hypothetical protein